MIFRRKSQSYFQLVLAAELVLSGCKDTKPRTSAPEPSPLPQPSLSEGTPASESAKDSAPRVSARPRSQVAENPQPSDPSALAKEFRAATEPERRGELVDAIWSLDTPAAVETLRQLYLTERELDVKIDIIAGLSDSKKPETREARFGLVVMALAQGQPKDIRELAAQMLVDFDDPRAISLLQQFAQDADPDMREAAKEALETRRAAEQP